MSEIQPYTVRLSSVVREKVQEYCVNHGLKQGYFVEKALMEKLERELDKNRDRTWQMASGADILKELGPMSDEEEGYYRDLQ